MRAGAAGAGAAGRLLGHAQRRGYEARGTAAGFRRPTIPCHPQPAAERRAISARLPRFSVCTFRRRSPAAFVPSRRHEGSLRSDRDQGCSRRRQGSLRVLPFSCCAPLHVAKAMPIGCSPGRKRRSSIAANGAMVLVKSGPSKGVGLTNSPGAQESLDRTGKTKATCSCC